MEIKLQALMDITLAEFISEPLGIIGRNSVESGNIYTYAMERGQSVCYS